MKSDLALGKTEFTLLLKIYDQKAVQKPTRQINRTSIKAHIDTYAYRKRPSYHCPFASASWTFPRATTQLLMSSEETSSGKACFSREGHEDIFVAYLSEKPSASVCMLDSKLACNPVWK